MKFSKDVFLILGKLASHNASHEELNQLIKISAIIARSYITKNYFRMSRLYEYFEANQDELALDAIAGLFCKDKDGKDYNIINSFRSWKPEIKTEEESFYFLNKIVASGIEQYLSEMLRESDPVFSKIFNSLNYTIRKMGYKKVERTGCRYIVGNNYEDTNRKLIDPQSFEDIPLNVFSGKEKYLPELFTYIESNGFAPAIPLNHLVSRLKRIYFNVPVSAITESINDSFTISELIDNSVKEMEVFIKEKYLDKGKITEEETTHFLHALKDMSTDLRDGGLSPGIHIYLEKYIPGLHESKMYDRYHNILEYLLKMLKKSISDRIITSKFSE